MACGNAIQAAWSRRNIQKEKLWRMKNWQLWQVTDGLLQQKRGTKSIEGRALILGFF
jgi:hypothetical protein